MFVEYRRLHEQQIVMIDGEDQCCTVSLPADSKCCVIKLCYSVVSVINKPRPF